ncbi:MBL fold metallo-hydrolase [Plantactinospora sp. GCM10030261]|uniref:MBL fold metallo-hydrolase n=1 Tax=Plantactinospora sp. GCM10030261 TaxID=3273420 RepID=UPI00361ADFFD
MRRPLTHLAGRVWLYPHDEDPANVQGSVAIIADDAGSVLVDSGNGPAAARRVMAAIADAGLPDPRRLVYTHHHWDHVWGACAWPDVEIIGHVAGARILADEARRPWSHDYLREQVAANPRLGPSFEARRRAMESWRDFVVLPPHTEFVDTLSLPGGIEVRHVGGGHAEDSTVVAVPDSGVLLLGDCFYPPPLHLRGPDDGYDVGLLRTLLDEKRSGRFDWYVDSHGEPSSAAAARALLAAADGGAG